MHGNVAKSADLAAAIALIKELGYAGLYSIENEQPGDRFSHEARSSGDQNRLVISWSFGLV